MTTKHCNLSSVYQQYNSCQTINNIRHCCLSSGSVHFLLTGPSSLPKASPCCTRPLFLKQVWRIFFYSFQSLKTSWKYTPFLHDFQRLWSLCKSTAFSLISRESTGHRKAHPIFAWPLKRTECPFENSCCQVLVTAGMSALIICVIVLPSLP